MEDRLYGPTGFYAASGEAGRRGDFLTSPEVGPLFGRLVAGWLDACWERLGRPAPFTMVEAGAGRGTLAAAVLRAQPACRGALRYVCVERSARLRERQRELLGDRVEVAAELPGPVGDGVVFANELLDNLPFRMLERTAVGWAEVWVGATGPVLRPLDGALPGWLPAEVAAGTRLPWAEAAAAWVGSARRLLERGEVLCVDYAVGATAELVGRPWLRTYRDHRVGDDPFVAAGEGAPAVDITADVPLDQLPPPTSVCTQAELLASWGIDEVVAEGRRRWAERGTTMDLEVIEARSRVHEAEALCDPGGLGGFLAVRWVS